MGGKTRGLNCSGKEGLKGMGVVGLGTNQCCILVMLPDFKVIVFMAKLISHNTFRAIKLLHLF